MFKVLASHAHLVSTTIYSFFPSQLLSDTNGFAVETQLWEPIIDKVVNSSKFVSCEPDKVKLAT